jgi:hypothetical protein
MASPGSNTYKWRDEHQAIHGLGPRQGIRDGEVSSIGNAQKRDPAEAEPGAQGLDVANVVPHVIGGRGV